MYVPKYAAVTDTDLLHDFIQTYSFGTLSTHADGNVYTNHFPFLIDRTSNTLLTHMARSNPQWKHLEANPRALAVFQGPHAYISPSYYVGTLEVPTWSYTAVHAYGPAEIIHDADGIETILAESVRVFESQKDGTPWIYNLPADFKAQLTKAIVGVRIRIESLEGKFKLSQNRDAADYESVVQEFAKRDDDNSRALLKYMSLTRPR